MIEGKFFFKINESVNASTGNLNIELINMKDEGKSYFISKNMICAIGFNSL